MKTKFILLSLAIILIALGIWSYAVSKSSPPEDALKTITEAYGTGTTTESVQENTVSITKENNDNKIMHATLHTNKGDITIEFDAVNAPNTAANFVKLAKTGFYNGVKFHRVIKGFMIQGGDPISKDDSQMARWGTGGPGYTFEDEITPDNHNDKGTISMANSGPDTNGSQFFINVANNNFLDPKHTVFGKVTSGMDVVTAIENTPTGQNDRPVEAVVIESVSF
jgi:peptidylprolyl isomerase